MSHRITNQSSIQAEVEEMNRSPATKVGAVTAFNGKVYAVDGREWRNTDGKVDLPKEEFLIDVGLMKKLEKNVLGAAGDPSALDDYASKIYSPKYLEYLDVYEKAQKALENTYSPYQRVLGAAGKAITPYETVRRAEDIIDVVGQQYDLTEYTALNAVTMRNSGKLRFKRPRKTSALMQVQKRLGDQYEPEVQRQAFTEGEVDVYADATQFQISMREESDTTFSISSEWLKELPGMFARAKDEKVTTLINALSNNNRGDWDAVTGNFYDADAALDVETDYKLIKKYGMTVIGMFASDSLRLYNKNQNAPLTKKTDDSTAPPGAKGPYTLANNAGITVFVNDDLTSQEYTLIAKESWADFYQAMTIQTSFKNERTAGQNEHRYWFDFNEVFQNTASAAAQGASVGA